MGKAEKLRERFLKTPKDFIWDELIAILADFAYHPLKTGESGGSRRKFVNINNDIISLHKPHPGSIVKQYALRQVIDFLKYKGEL